MRLGGYFLHFLPQGMIFRRQPELWVVRQKGLYFPRGAFNSKMKKGGGGTGKGEFSFLGGEINSRFKDFMGVPQNVFFFTVEKAVGGGA